MTFITAPEFICLIALLSPATTLRSSYFARHENNGSYRNNDLIHAVQKRQLFVTIPTTTLTARTVPTTRSTTRGLTADGNDTLGDNATGTFFSTTTKRTTVSLRPSLFGTCYTKLFDSSDKRIVEGFLYASTAWVIFWILLTVLFNACKRVFGGHRLLEVYQELGLIVLFVFMGVFVLRTNNFKLCKATTIILMFFLVFVLGVFAMQAVIASSFLTGRTAKNGQLPMIIYFLIPPVLAGVTCVGSYFPCEEFFAYSNVHCFCTTHTNFLWAFVVPAWIVWFLLIIRNQMGVDSLNRPLPSADQDQLFWSRRTNKMLPIVSSWFLMAYFALMFAVDMQALWLCIVYFAICLVFGPLLFYAHTFNHRETATAIYDKFHLSCYKPYVADQLSNENAAIVEHNASVVAATLPSASVRPSTLVPPLIMASHLRSPQGHFSELLILKTPSPPAYSAGGPNDLHHHGHRRRRVSPIFDIPPGEGQPLPVTSFGI